MSKSSGSIIKICTSTESCEKAGARCMAKAMYEQREGSHYFLVGGPYAAIYEPYLLCF
jgi:hypothetical protein